MRFNVLKTLSSKANKPSKQPKTYSDTPKKKSPNPENEDYLTLAEIRQGYNTIRMKLSHYKR